MDRIEVRKMSIEAKRSLNERLLSGVMQGARSATLALCFCSSSVAWAETGVFDTEILVGQSAVFSGPSARLGTEMRQGIEAYFHQVNQHGGVNGRTLKLVSRDDGYEPDRAAANTVHLIDDDKVFALLGYVGTPTSAAAIPIFTHAHVPFVGAFTGAPALRSFNRYVFNVRGSYDDEGEPIVKQLAVFNNRIALFVQDDAYGRAVRTSIEAALHRRGLRPVTVAVIPRNSLDVRAAADQIAASGATAVAMGSVYGACGELVKALRAKSIEPMYASVSFIGTSALIDEVGPNAAGIGIAQVMPSPMTDSLAVAREFHEAMTAAGTPSFTYGAMEGYIDAKVFVEGLRRAGPQPTREHFIAALESLGHYDAGGFAVAFSPQSHNGSNWTEMTVISRNKTVLR